MTKTARRVLAAVLPAVILCCSACNMVRVFDIDAPGAEPGTQTPSALPAETTGLAPVTQTAPAAPSVPETTLPQPETTPPQPETTTAPAQQLSVQEVIDLYANAVNLTRGYQGTLRVHHTETFSGNVVEAEPLGALTTKLANTLVGMAGKPADSTLTFTNGVGVNEDGDTVPILLPKKGVFTLPAAGVRNAFMDTANGMRHVVINLVPESVDFGGVPPYNAGAIGYLDTASMDFRVIKINSCTITYTGSVIDAYIRDDGYISSVDYTVNLSVSGSVTGLGITGSGTMEGVEYESWELQW